MYSKEPETLTTAKEISDLYGCSFDVTARVLRQLSQAGVLRSTQGAHGGYHLISDLQELSFHRLNSILVGPLGITKCLHESGSSCDLKSSCNIMTPVQKLNQKLQNFYQNLPVAELFSQATVATSAQSIQTIQNRVENL